MVYYATGNLSLIDGSWINICNTSVLKKDLQDALKLKNLSLMIKQKYNQNDHLSTMDASYDQIEDIKSKVVEEEVAKFYQLNLIWENDFFEVYLPKKATHN